jgi:hypothetical protein
LRRRSASRVCRVAQHCSVRSQFAKQIADLIPRDKQPQALHYAGQANGKRHKQWINRRSSPPSAGVVTIAGLANKNEPVAARNEKWGDCGIEIALDQVLCLGHLNGARKGSSLLSPSPNLATITCRLGFVTPGKSPPPEGRTIIKTVRCGIENRKHRALLKS